MTALADLQAGFSGYLLRQTDAVPVRPLVRVPDAADVQRRMHVYRNAYRERLHETLRSDYPVLLRLMGREAFAALAYACIDAHRSASPNIRWYGANLPAVAAGIAPWCEAPGLADMARFEWRIGLAFDAADAAPIDAGALAGVPAEAWAGLGFVLHPSLHLVWLGHAVPDWWLAVQDRDEAAADPPAPVADDGHWAIWRSEAGVRFRRLDTDEADALQAVQAGEGFGALCALLAEHVGEADAAGRAAGLLRVWLESGWIAGLRLPEAAA